MSAALKNAIIARLEAAFHGPGRAAAVNEVLTADRYPEYLAGILADSAGLGLEEALVSWGLRRGRMWE